MKGIKFKVFVLCMFICSAVVIVSFNLFPMAANDCMICQPSDCLYDIEAACQTLAGEGWYCQGFFIQGSWCMSWGVCFQDFDVLCTREVGGGFEQKYEQATCVNWACEECEVH
jgi:hypothetical protein